MVKNKAEFSGLELFGIMEGYELVNIQTKDIFTPVFVDSRECTSGSIFVALDGENSNGHEYISKAFENGAGVAIVEKKWYGMNKDKYQNKKFIVADSSLKALHILASYHRRRFSFPVIAVAGSNGKTSTKEMLACVLSKKYNVLQTYANYNNQLGVPLMLLSLDESYGAAIIEIGTNMPGEIEILSRILSPTHGLITNIGKEHLELLEDLDGVEIEEIALFGYLRGRGTAFINVNDERLRKYTKSQDKHITYGIDEEAAVSGELTLDNETMRPHIKIKMQEREMECTLNTYGIHSAYNAIASVAIAIDLDLSNEEIVQGLLDFTPLKMGDYARMSYEKISGYNIINDCYNANPSSVEGALENLTMIETDAKKIAVLGDMLELGAASVAEHSRIIDLASQVADKVFLYGDDFSKAIKETKKENVEYFADKESLAKYLIKFINMGDIILIKGSRGKKMEEIVTYIENIS